jgi:hypothetical protein
MTPRDYPVIVTGIATGDSAADAQESLDNGDWTVWTADVVDTSDSESLAELALNALWSVVAGAHPEITTGDLPPDADANLNNAATDAIRVWLWANAPTEDGR